MASPVRCLHEVEDLTTVVNLLQDNEHGGFPVISQTGTFEGLITRFELMTIVCKIFDGRQLQFREDIHLEISHQEFADMRAGKLPNNWVDVLTQATDIIQTVETGVRVDLRNFVNKSAMSVHERFSLQRTYKIKKSSV